MENVETVGTAERFRSIGRVEIYSFTGSLLLGSQSFRGLQIAEILASFIDAYSKCYGFLFRLVFVYIDLMCLDLQFNVFGRFFERFKFYFIEI